jgi:hypothetical protein
MKELTEWVDRNQHRTWHWPNFGKTKLSLEIKYLSFSLDTRDMTVWSLSYSGLGGGGKEIHIRDTRDDGDWTILNELEKNLDADVASGAKGPQE